MNVLQFEDIKKFISWETFSILNYPHLTPEQLYNYLSKLKFQECPSKPFFGSKFDSKDSIILLTPQFLSGYLFNLLILAPTGVITI